MAVSFQAPEKLGGSSTYLESKNATENEGKYLVVVNDGHEDAKPEKGGELKAIEGFSVEVEIKAGKNEGKKFTAVYYNGKENHKDKGAFKSGLQASFAIAADLIKVSDLGKNVSFELADSVGSICVIELKLGDKNDSGDQYLEALFCYHVDDPRVKSFLTGKDIAADVKTILDGIPKENRHDEAYFAPLLKKAENPKKETSRVKDEDFEGL